MGRGGGMRHLHLASIVGKCLGYRGKGQGMSESVRGVRGFLDIYPVMGYIKHDGVPGNRSKVRSEAAFEVALGYPAEVRDPDGCTSDSGPDRSSFLDKLWEAEGFNEEVPLPPDAKS